MVWFFNLYVITIWGKLNNNNKKVLKSKNPAEAGFYISKVLKR